MTSQPISSWKMLLAITTFSIAAVKTPITTKNHV